MTMDCMLETQDLAMNGGTPSGAFYPHRTAYIYMRGGGLQWEIILEMINVTGSYSLH